LHPAVRASEFGQSAPELKQLTHNGRPMAFEICTSMLYLSACHCSIG